MTTDRTNLTLSSIAYDQQTAALSGKSTDIQTFESATPLSISIWCYGVQENKQMWSELFQLITVVVQIHNTEFLLESLVYLNGKCDQERFIF